MRKKLRKKQYKNLLCKWFGHMLPCYRQEGWYSPGEMYGQMIGGNVDGIQRVHVDLWAECDRCGDKFQVMKAHVPGEVMKTCYQILSLIHI